ncbi:MAG: type II toxin-antitoxin system RelE/ParE family toxin [Robiginitomaculum sp.]|nr:type II toxin-antitoxin system RelE/ParE family toxin [Robiginitomaculum sp.]
MTGYRISKAAQADLIKIAQYGDENYGIERSNQFRDQLKKQFEILAQNPRLFRERWELSPPVRICPFKPYVILYKITQAEIIIVRVRHEREDW